MNDLEELAKALKENPGGGAIYFQNVLPDNAIITHGIYCGTSENRITITIEPDGTMKQSGGGMCMLPGGHSEPHVFEDPAPYVRHAKHIIRKAMKGK